jgi:hypothetical protein
MRTYLGLAMVFALVVSVGPALAGESFHALSPLPEAQLAALTLLPDAQLAIIEGTGGQLGVEVWLAWLTLAPGTQDNVAVGDDIAQLIARLNAVSERQAIVQRNWTTGAPGPQVNVAAVTQTR